MEDEEAAAVLRTVGRQIKMWREAAGLKQAELGSAIGYGEEMVSSVERARRVPKPDFLDKADEVLGAGGKLSAMKEDVEKARYPKKVRDLTRLEDEAVELGAYASMHIHGLLQTPEYAHALYAMRRPAYTEEEIERLVTARMARKAVFERAPRPLLTFVQEESTLRRPIGGKMILRRQLEHLLSVGGLRHVSIQVMPTDRGGPCGLDGPVPGAEAAGRQDSGSLSGPVARPSHQRPTGRPDPGHALWNDPSAGALTPGVTSLHRESTGRRDMTPVPPRWFKSSYSGNDDADCVEAAILQLPHPTIHIRDSKNKDGSRLAFTGGAWSEFLEFTAGR